MAVTRYRHVFYTPEDDVKGFVDSLPDQAQRSIDVEIYGLTDMVLINSLIRAAARGVKVQVMNDRTQAAGPSDHKALQTLVDTESANITIKVVESITGAIDHLKLIVIDGADGPLADTSSVGYGSFNFSNSSQRQDNVFVHTNDPGEVDQAMRKFERDWTVNKQDSAWQIQPSSTYEGGQYDH